MEWDEAEYVCALGMVAVDECACTHAHAWVQHARNIEIDEIIGAV